MDKDYLQEGRKALEVGAWESARDLLYQAVALNASPEALEALAWANWWLIQVDDVFSLRQKAYHAFLKEGDPRGASRNASWLGLDHLEFNGEFAVANGWFQRAENLLEGSENCPELILIRNLKANLLFRVEKNTSAAIDLLDQNIQMARQLSDTEGLMLAEALKGFMLVTEGSVNEGMRLLDEATLIALNDETGDIHSITTTCCFLIDACQRVRDYDRAGQWCDKVKEICKRWRHRAVFATCRTQYANVLICRGQWSEAEEELLAARKELESYKPASVPICLIRMAELKRRQGKWFESLELLGQVGAHPLKTLCSAEVAYDRGDYEEAESLAQQFLARIPQHERTERLAGLELLLRAQIKCNKESEAGYLVEELESIANKMMIAPVQASYSFAKGLLLLATTKFESARTLLTDAVFQYDELKAPYEAARARLSLAEVLDCLHLEQAAQEELSQALRIFVQLGARADEDRTKHQMKHGVARQTDLDFTPRELVMLKLISKGKNNDEIASELFVSVRTVEKHLSNIYQKLGTSGKSARAYASSYAAKKFKL